MIKKPFFKRKEIHFKMFNIHSKFKKSFIFLKVTTQLKIFYSLRCDELVILNIT